MEISLHKIRHLLILFFILIFINIVNCSTFDIARNILSLDEIEDNYFINKQININNNLNYLYTEYSSDSLYNKSYIHSYKIQFHSPAINKKIQFGGSVQLNYSDYKKILGSEYTYGSINLLTNNYSIYLKTKLDDSFYSINYKYKFIDDNFLLSVNKFPHSETDLVNNKYFYDLLEPTFGDSLKFNPKLKSHIINIYYSAPQISGFHPFINLQYEFVDIKIYESHLNTNSPTLKGERYTQIRSIYNPFKIKVGTTFRDNNMIFVGYSKTNLEPKWNQIIYPKLYDIRNLSTGNFKLYNWEIGYKNNSYKKYFFLGVSQGELKWQQELSTPVLGYFSFLPIAHQGNMNLQTSHKTQIIQYGYYLNKNKFLFNPEFGYIHSLLSIDISYIANLEFGLTSINEHNNYLYDVNLFNLKLHNSYNLKEKIKIYLDCSQMIPYIRKISEKKPPIEHEKTRKKYYGGLMIEIGIKYYY